MSTFMNETPWDRTALGIPTYELTALSDTAFELLKDLKGHFTVKVDPLASKEALHRHGFYYCDTLLEPYCNNQMLVEAPHHDISIRYDADLDELLLKFHGAFSHGRFHRDFGIARSGADKRYDNWIRQLYESGNIFTIHHTNALAAFFGINGSKVVLHAVSEDFRGKGLAKNFWSAGYRELFDRGHKELSSSVSAANTAVVNLYASLGFRFRNPIDVYHCFNS